MATLFTATFELGHFGDFSPSNNGKIAVRGGKIFVSGAAALAGSYGMGVEIATLFTYYAYVAREYSLSGLSGCTVEFYLDPNSITIPSGNHFFIVYVRESATDYRAMRLELGYTSGNYWLRASFEDDIGALYYTSSYTISDASHVVSIGVSRATGATASDGVGELIIDSVSQQIITGIDNYDKFPQTDEFMFGAIAASTGGPGTLYIDGITVTDGEPTGEPTYAHIILSGRAVLSARALIGT